METTTETKIYRLKPYEPDFCTGFIKDGVQVFMAINYPELLTVFFDTEGRYFQYLVREISQETQALLIKGSKESFLAMKIKEWDELKLWAAELGFKEGTIAVQRFCLPEYDLCIHDLPEILQELLDSGDEIDDDTKEWMELWQERGTYVLIWGNDYYIDRDGKVKST